MPGPYVSYNTNPDYPNPEHQTGGQGMGGSDWIAALISVAYDMYAANRQHKQNIKAENKARQWNLEQWHRQNLYNHPTQQMERLLAAGLNPNMIYGSSPGSAVGNAGAVAPGKAVARMQMPFGAIGTALQARVNQAQTNNLKADSMLKGTQSLKTAVESGMKGRELDLLNERFDDLVGLTKTELAVKNIDYKLREGVLPHKIASAMSQAEKDSLAVGLLQKDLELAQQGYVKGSYLGTILGNAFGINLNTKEGRLKAQVIVGAVLGSSVFKNLTQGLQSSLKQLNKIRKR